MKKLIPAIIVFALCSMNGFAQYYGTNGGATVPSSNNVGIGTSAPKAKLDVRGGHAYVGGGFTEAELGVWLGLNPNARGLTISGNSGANGFLCIGSGTETANATVGQIVFGQKTAASNGFAAAKGFINVQAQGSGGTTYGYGSSMTFNTSGDNTGSFERMRLDHKGNVGIGITAPTARLHLPAGTATANTAPLKFVSGPLNTTSEAGAIEFLTDKYYATITTGAARKTFAFLESPVFTGIPAAPTAAPGTNTTQLATTAFVTAAASNASWTKTGNSALAGDFIGTTNATDFLIKTTGTSRMVIKADGTVGIGAFPMLTSNPNGYLLAVKGTIGAYEIKVENTSAAWADYVFEKEYKLMPLTELETYLKNNKHLPEVPSAKEIEDANGFYLGEMQVTLLKKVEELTLHVIELNKEIEKLKLK